MDSLTHILLGAAIGDKCLGKKLGNRAMIVGAIAETVPDLDVFVNVFLKDDLAGIQIHRSYTHSIFTAILLAPLLAWLTHLVFKRKIEFNKWWLLWMLGWGTHILLDCCTTYGTQMFLPFTNYLVGLNNIAVADAFFTIPFLILIIASLFFKKENKRRHQIINVSVIFICSYIALTFVNKLYIDSMFRKEFKEKNITYESHSTSPSILNNFLWAGMAVNDSMLYCGEYSIFQKKDNIKLYSYKRNLNEEKKWAGHELEVMKWFSQGYYFIEPKGTDTLSFYMTKWGRANFKESAADKTFLFHYDLIRNENSIKVKAIKPVFSDGEFSDALLDLWKRMFGMN